MKRLRCGLWPCAVTSSSLGRERGEPSVPLRLGRGRAGAIQQMSAEVRLVPAPQGPRQEPWGPSRTRGGLCHGEPAPPQGARWTVWGGC